MPHKTSNLKQTPESMSDLNYFSMKKLYSLILLGAMTAYASAFEASPVRVNSSVLGYAKENQPTRITAPQKDMLKAPATAASGTWSDWTSAGTCTFNIDNGLADFGTMVDYTGSFTGIPLDYREDTGDANLCQYRLNGVYNGKELVIDVNRNTGAVYVFPQETGFDCYGASPMQVMDCGTAFREIAQDDEMAAVYDAYNYFIEPLGRIYIYLGYTFEGLGDLCALTDATVQFDGYPDFTPELSFKQRYSADGEAKGIIKTTESAEYVNVGLFPGFVTQSKINAVMAGGEGIFKVASGEAEFALPEMQPNVPYTMFAISYVGNVACEMATQYVTRIDAEEGKWKSLGTTDVTADLIESIFGMTLTRTQAEIQQNLDNPGRYRIKGLYKNSMYAPDDLDQYLTFDLSDPDYVTLEPSNIGLELGSGSIIALTGYYYYLDRGNSEESARSNAKAGKYNAATRTVSFSDDCLLVSSDNWAAVGGDNGAFYYANASGKMSFTIPDESTGIDSIAVDGNGSCRLFNLQGVEVTGKPAPGVYIETRGGKATKILVR